MAQTSLPPSPRRVGARYRVQLAVGALAAAAISLLHPASASAAASTEDLERTLMERVDALVGASATGATVVVTRGDSRLIGVAEGHANAEQTTPLTLATRTPVASVSKVPTALAALTLDAENTLDLTVDLRKNDAVRLVDERPEPDRSPVTGWNLLTHHAGLDESILLYPDARGVADDQPLADWLNAHAPVLRHAAVGMHYSALQGHTIIGSLMESTTGDTFDDIVSRTVFEVVGASTASYRTTPQDAQLSAPADGGWTHTPWPYAPERPASALVWSAQDAEALLKALSPESDVLPEEVRTRALETAVLPDHGGAGHTGVFFDEVRDGVRVLEHAGANGVARIAYVPAADIGVYVATTSETAEAGAMTDMVIDDVARWARDSGLVGERVDPPRQPVHPSWAPAASTTDPSGLFAERLFGDRPFERPLRALLGQVRVDVDGDTLRIGAREYRAETANGWCSPDGCVTAVQTDSGAVTLLRGDRGMLEQTLDAVPWWRDGTLALASLSVAPVLGIIAIAAAIRARIHRRRGQKLPAAPSRLLAGLWSALALVAVVGAVTLPLLPVIDSQAFAPLAPTSPALLAVIAVAVAAVVAGGLWLVSAARAFPHRTLSARICSVVGGVLGLAATWTLVDWTLIPAGV